MTNDQNYSFAIEIVAQTLMIITSLTIIVVSYLCVTKKLSIHKASLFQSTGYAFFLPLMSYMFSQAWQYNPEGRAQAILIWTVLMETIRVGIDNDYTWQLRKSAEKLVQLFWIGFLVYNYQPQKGIMVSLFVLCIHFFIMEIINGFTLKKAKASYLIGKNSNLINNYMKRVMLQDELVNTPMNCCAYIVMGEKDHEIAICHNGYHLGIQKSNCQGVLTIGRVFQLNSEDGVFTSAFPNWRDNCVSLALAKMLMRRFDKLPVDEAGCQKALNFVLEGLVDYIGKNRDIQYEGNNLERNPIDRVFGIIEDELKYVSEFLHTKVLIDQYFPWYQRVDKMGFFIVLDTGIYLIYQILRILASHSFKAQDEHFFYVLAIATSVLLVVACLYLYVQLSRWTQTDRWSNLKYINKYIENPLKWISSNSSSAAFNTCVLLPCRFRSFIKGALRKEHGKDLRRRHFSSVLDANEVDLSIFAFLPRWNTKIIPTVVPDAKEAILQSLKNSGGQLTNGETSLKRYGKEYLIWAFCQPYGSTTEAILIWHIATTLFHHQEASLEQNNVPHQEPPPQQNNSPFTKKQEVALALSSYCHYLVKFFPELLPDQVDWTKDIYERVIQEVLAIPTKENRCNYALQTKWSESFLGGKSVMLANDLMNNAKNGAPVWTMLADFWAEMMLFIAPSDNVEAHEKILDQKEFITQIWALLTHAGIVARPKPTEHQDHQRESNHEEEQEEAVKEGMLTIDRYDDILGKSLQNPEHSGRVRGVGSLVGIKKAYAGCRKRKMHTSSKSKASIEQRIQREVEERMKPFMKMMESKMAMLMGQQMNTENPAASSIGAVQSQSNCPSVQPTHFLNSIQEERTCKLHLVRDGQKIQVAVGTIYAGTFIHGRPVPPSHVRVMVDDYIAGEDETHVPVPNDEVVTLRSARSSFTAWPKDMISLDEESRKELQVPTSGKLVHSDGFKGDQYKGFQGINFVQLDPTFESLRDRFVKQVGNAFLINLPIDIFHSEDPISVHAEDLKALLTPETMLTGPIIQIFMMYVHKYYKDKFVGFMDPGKTCGQFLSGDDHDRQFVEEYITKALKKNWNKKIIFLPYHQDMHWILIALMPRESTFYVFDSMSVECPKKVYKIIKALEGPFLTESCTEGLGKAKWKRSTVKCAQQVGSWECGYYVMLFVYDIITRFLDVFPNLTDFPKEYNGTNIKNMRILWGKFFLEEVLG